MALQDYAKVGGTDVTVNQIKNDVANENGFNSWTALFLDSLNGGGTLLIHNCWQEVATRCLTAKTL